MPRPKKLARCKPNIILLEEVPYFMPLEAFTYISRLSRTVSPESHAIYRVRCKSAVHSRIPARAGGECKAHTLHRAPVYPKSNKVVILPSFGLTRTNLAKPDWPSSWDKKRD